MAKVFVDPNELTSVSGTVPIYAVYADLAVVSESTHPGKTIMTIPNNCVLADPKSAQMKMDQSWRNDAVASAAMVDAEAFNRIQVVFPDDQQRKANATLNDHILNYGADVSQWPQAAKDDKAAIDQGWAYVRSVNTSATALKQGGSLPLDPTNDQFWPPVIPPINF